MKGVYIAGKLSDPDCCKYLQNVHDMIDFGTGIEKEFENISCYKPCTDFIDGIYVGNLSYIDYINRNMIWLKKSDALIVMPNSEKSTGTQMEIEEFKKLNRPIFFYQDYLFRDEFLEDLGKWLNE